MDELEELQETVKVLETELTRVWAFLLDYVAFQGQTLSLRKTFSPTYVAPAVEALRAVSTRDDNGPALDLLRGMRA